uniref:Myb/SANT-like domain-containing protein n=2 Tax=Kalanchoe fedtschenkoi TaxID=63787 RepID=A0A7N0UFZ6_KALFE
MMASRPLRSRRHPELQQEQQARAKWTAYLTKILVDSMVQQAQQGNRTRSSFNKTAWISICDDFQLKTGFNWDKEQLKNRYSVLRKQYTLVSSLLAQTDFSFDESTGAILAADDTWDAYVKEHPDAEVLKSSGCPFYRELSIIFADMVSKSNGSYLESVQNNNEVTYYKSSLPDNLTVKVEESSSESEDDAMGDDQDKYEQSTPRTPSGRKRGRKGVDGSIAAAILEMASASKLKTTAIKLQHSRYSISNCIKELDKLQDVDEDIYYAALDLFDNRVAREMFLSLKVDKRLTWLVGKMRRSRLCS